MQTVQSCNTHLPIPGSLRRLFFAVLLLTAGDARAQNLAKATNIQMVVGAGTRVNINGGITFTGTSVLTNNGHITLGSNNLGGRENWVDSTTNILHTAGTGTVTLQSDSLQYIIGPTRFYHLVINADSGVSIADQPIEVRNLLQLNKGLLYTTATNYVHVSNPALTAIQSASSFANSWVHGALWRSTNSSAGEYLFPVGKILLPDSLYAPVKIKKINNNTAVYKTEYFPAQPFDRGNFLNPPIDHISDVEYWHIESDIVSGTNDDASVSLSWRPYSQVSPNPATRDSLLVAQYINNSGFRWEAMFNTAQANLVSGTAAFGYVTTNLVVGSFTNAERRFTLGSRSPFNILPVQLLYWNAVLNNNRVVDLAWHIDKDDQALRYEVERSLSGNLFSTIGTVAARRLSGIQVYTALDAQPASGYNYYRLKIYGADNRYFYSGIQKVWMNDKAGISLYPNPVQDQLYITAPGANGRQKLFIYDAGGRLVYQQLLGNYTQAINMGSFAKGMYMVQVQVQSADGLILLNKMVLKD